MAPAAVRAVTDWVFDAFAGASLRQIMLVHDVDNPASCRVAEKAGYPFRELSPANPPHWFEDGHIHVRWAADPGSPRVPQVDRAPITSETVPHSW